jgi:hypothetical protein
MNPKDIESLLQSIGEKISTPSVLILVGGGALALLGSPRPTIDLDFIGDDLTPSDLHRQVIRLAEDLNIHAEPIPLERFIPLPEGSHERNIRIGRFGGLEVFVADPYSIALSKLDRGFDTDLDDIIFLLRRNLVQWEELDRIARASLDHAREFDLNPAQLLSNLQAVHRRMSGE